MANNGRLWPSTLKTLGLISKTFNVETGEFNFLKLRTAEELVKLSKDKRDNLKAYSEECKNSPNNLEKMYALNTLFFLKQVDSWKQKEDLKRDIQGPVSRQLDIFS